MGLITLIFTAISLAMDAFTVAIAKGISLKEAKPHQAMKVAFFFGGFQALMPFIGWTLGQSFEKYISAFTPWIALILLCTRISATETTLAFGIVRTAISIF